MAPAQATQSPPDLTKLYLQLLQRNRSADEIDRGLTNIVAAFSPPSQQASVMANMPRGTNTGDEMSNLMQLQQYGLGQQSLAQMMSPEFLKNMETNYGMSAPEARAMILSGGMPNFITKVVEARTGVGADLETRQYLQEQRAAQSQGKPFPDVATWKAQHAATALSMNTQAKDIQDFKDTGIQDFSGANQKLTENEARVDQLMKNPDATMEALSKPDLLTTSKAANMIPSGTPLIGTSSEVKQQAIAIQKLMAGLTGEGLMSAKNVRTQREFSTLGEALTAGLNVNNGKEGVMQALTDIKKRFATAHAQVYAVAGKKIPSDYYGLADPRYTSPTMDGAVNPYYTGATEEQPKEGAAPAPDQAVGQPPAPNAKKASDGNWYVPDPARPGKYLKVE
jgi:hypothetical protein